MSFVSEFKELAVKGNAVDMAVGIILGVAFARAVNSPVNGILMPPIGMMIGGVEFQHLAVILREASTCRQRTPSADRGTERLSGGEIHEPPHPRA